MNDEQEAHYYKRMTPDARLAERLKNYSLMAVGFSLGAFSVSVIFAIFGG